MTSYVDFWVSGEPVPQGSMVSVGGRGAMRHSNKELTAWREEIGWGWKRQYRGGVITRGTPVRLELTFFVTPNAAALKEQRRLPAIRGEGGDLDKLARAVKDALEELAYEDDAQVAHLDALKLYSTSQPQEAAGVRIRLARYHFGPAPWPSRWAQLR